jgi:two-component system, cell cycle response regulator DivK
MIPLQSLGEHDLDRRPGRWRSAPDWTPDTGVRARPRGLIVDDDEDTRELYAWSLRAAGWVVEAVSGGEEALDVARDFLPDAIVMDLRLPTISGLEVTRRLKANAATRRIPIVACSGVDLGQARTLARRAGCEEFVAKPCSPEVLRLVLESVVAGRGAPV